MKGHAFAAYLRIYQPLAAFPPRERAEWAAYVEAGQVLPASLLVGREERRGLARALGLTVGAEREVTGEVVFTTGMSGYQESMTDPSFARQLITFTTAHVGNYGVSPEAWESDRIHAAGAIMREAVNTVDAPGAELAQPRVGLRHEREPMAAQVPAAPEPTADPGSSGTAGWGSIAAGSFGAMIGSTDMNRPSAGSLTIVCLPSVAMSAPWR
jgi:hypothetical protein